MEMTQLQAIRWLETALSDFVNLLPPSARPATQAFAQQALTVAIQVRAPEPAAAPAPAAVAAAPTPEAPALPEA